MSGSVGLAKNGAGTLEVSAANTYTGTTAIDAGTLLIDGNQASSPVTVKSGATLGGVGTVNTITANGGTVSPGDSTAGILVDTGGLSLGLDTSSNNSAYSVVIDGPTAGTGYAQLQVAGAINLTAATLKVTLGPEFTPSLGSSFTIIDNTSNQSVSGTFNGLPQGATITVGGVTFEVIYNGGANANSVVLSEVDPSTTTFDVSPSSTTYGQSVALTANVSGSPSGGTPTGSVDFFQGSTLLGTETLTAGSATLNTSTLPVGTNSITAQYQGNANFAPSTSTASSVTVALAPTTTAVTFSPASPALGANVTLTATITPATSGGAAPTGTVNFLNGSVVLGSATVASNQATFSTTTLPAGSNSITAEYTGDANYATSTSPVTPVTVAQVSTTTTVTYSPTLPVFGQQVTLTATITPASTLSALPSGTVDFFNGSTLLGTGTVSTGSATLTTTALAVGNNSITAQYLGDGTYGGSTSAVDSAAVVLAPTTTTLAPLSNTSPAPFEQVTLTATVAVVSPGAGTLSGKVTFLANGASLGTANVSGGTATLSIALPIAHDSITAQYSSDPNFQNSTSNAVTAVVGTANQQWLNSVSFLELNRAPTKAELTRWDNWLAHGVSRKQVVTRIAHTPGAAQVSLQTLFTNLLGTPGTPAAYVGTSKAAEATHTSHTAVLLGSRDFFNISGGTLPTYLAGVETAAIGFAIEQPHIQNQLEKGVLPAKVAEEIVQNKLAWQQLISTNYENVLGSAPTPGELSFLVHQLSRGIFLRQILIPLISGSKFFKNATSPSSG
jgi:autotransporter-associated beta strand protein